MIESSQVGGEIISHMWRKMLQVMKTYGIDTGAHAAHKQIGVDLRIDLITEQRGDDIYNYLVACSAHELVVSTLADAVRASKPRRSRKHSGKAGETKQEGPTHES